MFRLEPSLLNVLIGQIATLSSVYHKPPDAFVVRRGAGITGGIDDDDDDADDYEGENDVGDGDLLDIGGLAVSDVGAVSRAYHCLVGRELSMAPLH